MAKSSSRGTSQDRKLVAGEQEHEVYYESKKTGASKEAVKKTIKKEGNKRTEVEKKISKK